MSAIRKAFATDRATLWHGDCADVASVIAPESIDAIVTDPPAGISFMGKAWDGDKGGRDQWIAWLRDVMRTAMGLLKPGGHALVWALPRTSHWTATAIEDAGFEIRDVGIHLFGTGFPKSLDVSKAIDAHGGTEVGWFGPWLRSWREKMGVRQAQVAELFPSKTGNRTGCVANWELGYNMPTPDQFNLICRTFGFPFDSIEAAKREVLETRRDPGGRTTTIMGGQGPRDYDVTAPATAEAELHDGTGTALKPAAEHWILARRPLSGTVASNVIQFGTGGLRIDDCRVSDDARWPAHVTLDEDAAPAVDAQSGGASRFFYVAKATRAEKDAGLDHLPLRTGGDATDREEGSAGLNSPRAGSGRNGGVRNHHPTVKSIALMRWLCRLITPPGGIVLDLFAGSGTTGLAALAEGLRFVGVEREAEFVDVAAGRLAHVECVAIPDLVQADAPKVEPVQPSLFGAVAP